MEKLTIIIDGLVADFVDTEAFPLVFSEQGINISNVTQKSGNGSFTVTFPNTDNNKKIFKHKQNLAVKDKFKISREYFAEIYVGDNNIFSGAFRLLEVTESNYKGFFLVSDAVWFNDLANKSMRDLKIKEIDFAGHAGSGLNVEYVIETKTRANYPAEHPLVCYGGFYRPDVSGVNLAGIYTGNYSDNFQSYPPHLYLKEVLEKMFSDINWRINGDLLSADRVDWIISKAGKDESFWNWWRVGYTAMYMTSAYDLKFNILANTHTGDFLKTYRSGIIEKEGGESCDLNPYFTIGVLKRLSLTQKYNEGLQFRNNEWVCAIDGIYSFNSGFNYTTSRTDDWSTGCDVWIPDGAGVKNKAVYIAAKNWTGTNEQMLDSIYNTLAAGTPYAFNPDFVDFGVGTPPKVGSIGIIDGEGDIELIKGDTITFFIAYVHSDVIRDSTAYDYGAIFNLDGLRAGGVSNQGFARRLTYSGEIAIYPDATESPDCVKNYDTDSLVPAYRTLEIGRSLPNISQQDFIRGLMNMFNLYTVVDVDNRVINFKTGANFYKNTGVYNDITEFIDFSNYTITPKGLPKQFRLSYTDDPNDKNDNSLDLTILKQNKDIYSEPENIIQLPFALTKMHPFLTGGEVGSLVNLPFIYDPTFTSQNTWDTSFNYVPRFFIYQGLGTVRNNFISGSYQPLVSICSIPNIGAGVLYNSFYNPLFGDYNTKEAVEININMDIELYKRLRLDIPVMINGILYNIERKSNFAPLKNAFTKLILIRR
jgi:hypothetical protein